MSTDAPDVEVGIALTESAYLIEAHVTVQPHGRVRAAYAVRDAWGWAIHAKRAGGVRTVGRVDRGPTTVARERARDWLRWLGAGFRRPEPD